MQPNSPHQPTSAHISQQPSARLRRSWRRHPHCWHPELEAQPGACRGRPGLHGCGAQMEPWPCLEQHDFRELDARNPNHPNPTFFCMFDFRISLFTFFLRSLELEVSPVNRTAASTWTALPSRQSWSPRVGGASESRSAASGWRFPI